MAALHFMLPLEGVSIDADGTGRTRYARPFGPGEAEAWAIGRHGAALTLGRLRAGLFWPALIELEYTAGRWQV